MPLPGCSISVGLDGQQALVRLAGRLAAESAPAFEKLIVRLKASGVRCAVLDLSDALLMDSGFSGTLSRMIGAGGIAFALHGTPQRVLDGLDDHGVLEQVTNLETGITPGSVTATAIDLGPADRSEVLRCCLDAHRALMALKPENVAKFETVEKFLSREVEKLQSPTSTARASG